MIFWIFAVAYLASGWFNFLLFLLYLILFFIPLTALFFHLVTKTKILRDFDKILGLNKLHAIHLNNSKLLLNSCIDRHEKIAKGKIPLETFEFIMNDPKLKDIPKVLETPVLKDPLKEYGEEIILLKTLIKKSNR